jgi:hypothetical protein
MPRSNQGRPDINNQVTPVNDSQPSEVIIKFFWFFVHIKNPNRHTIEIVKRGLKFCQLLLYLAFVNFLFKFILLLVR